MTSRPDTAGPSRPFDLSALDRTDRALLGGCVAVWLVALGAAVAATVALVNLGSGHSDSGGSGTPWFLYAVIAVSAVVIAGAIPLLIRARRESQENEVATGEPQTPVRRGDAPTEKLRIAPPRGAEAGGSLPRALLRPPGTLGSPVVDQLWLRCALGIACVMGVATFLVGVSTYLMAVDTDVVAWVLYGVAGVVTAGMAALPWYFLRELRTEITN